MSRPAKAMPSVEDLRRIVTYEPSTGCFFWTEEAAAKKWSKRAAGSRADHVDRNGGGYRRIRIDGRSYWAHRIAFKIYHGREPQGEIDHIDGHKEHNAISNLREADRSQQACNRPGWGKQPKGVWRRPGNHRNPFEARIALRGRKINLGSFATAAEAAEAYNNKARELHGEFYQSAPELKADPTP